MKNKARKTGAFLSLALIAGIWRNIADRWALTTGWKRWALLAAGGVATGVLVALIIRAFL